MNALRPRDLGSLLDAAVRFWRSEWKPLFLLVLGFQLVESVLVSVNEAAGRALFPLARSPETIQQDPVAALPDLGGRAGLAMVTIIASLFVGQVASVAVSWFSSQRLLGKASPTPADAFRHAGARLGPSLGAMALSLGWTVIVGLFFCIPAFVLTGGTVVAAGNESGRLAQVLAVFASLAFLGALALLVVWFVLRFLLLAQIIAMEPVSALEAFRRADALSSGQIGEGVLGLVKFRLTVLVTVIGVVLLVVSVMANLPMLIAGVVYGASFAPGNGVTDVLPLWIFVPLQLLQTAVGALVAPLYVVFQVFFYLDMRARREGLDLELALDGSEAVAPVTT